MSVVSPCLRLIYDEAYSGAHQMATDEFLFRSHIETKNQTAVLRFYHFSEPTFTVGYGLWSKVRESLPEEVPVVRRITGGGIVSHQISDLTYAFIAPYTSFLSLRKTRGSYLFIHEALKRALLDFDIKTSFFEGCCDQHLPSPLSGGRLGWEDNQKTDYCFESPVLYDVMLGSKKIAGAGQKRSLGFLLHQGSIAWNLLKQAAPKISEIGFCSAFSKHLAKMLNLNIREIPFTIEEMEQARLRHRSQSNLSLSFPQSLGGNPDYRSPTLSEKDVKLFPKSAPRVGAGAKTFGDDRDCFATNNAGSQ